MDSDESELEQAYLQMRPQLLRYASGRVGAAGDSEDLVQEAWLRVRRHAPAVLAAPLPYMMRVMRNLIIDHGRVRARRLRQDEVNALLEVPGDLPGPEEAAIARSQLRLFARALSGLPVRRRDILIAARLRREPYTQIAARHGVSVRTVEYEVRLALDHCIAAMAAAEGIGDANEEEHG